MAIGSDNVFPKLLLGEVTTPATPSSGHQSLFLDSGDGDKLKRVNSSGTVTTIERSAASYQWISKTTTYTAVAGDFVAADATSGAFTVTLPTAVGVTTPIAVKKVDSSVHAITIATTSSQTIDGASTKAVGTQYDGYVLVSDGSNWLVAAVLLEGSTGPAGELGYAAVTTASWNTTSGTLVDMSGLSVTVTVGTRPVIVTLYISQWSHSVNNARAEAALVDSTAGTVVQQNIIAAGGTGNGQGFSVIARVQPGAGSRTYKAQYKAVDAGTVTMNAGSTQPAFIQVVEV